MSSRSQGQLYDNAYNRHRRQDEPKFKFWRYAGLILTYKCTAACEFCYYNCDTDRAGLMPVETAIQTWESIQNLTCNTAKIHITGGEPFLFFDHLIEIMTQAQKEKLTPVDIIETNAFWAVDRNTIIDRLKLLDSVGMHRLKISWDPFHAEFIDVEPVRLLAQISTEVLGPDRVLVRWRKYLQEPVKISELGQVQRQQLFRSALQDYPCRFTGRAAGYLASLFADKPAQELLSESCKSAFLSSKGVHIDPYGNVFSGLCSGIIVGNVEQMPLEDIWKSFEPDNVDLIGILFNNGPVGLLPEAVRLGYKGGNTYASKCHLCTNLRQFFFDNGNYKSIIGPCDCYNRASEKVREN